jgi:hypothetical protein
MSFLDISISMTLAVDHSTKNPTALPVNSFIPRTIIKNIICHVVYQIIVLLVLLFVGNILIFSNFSILFLGERLLYIESGRWSPLGYPPSIHFTIIFNTFVMMTLFNGINCRMLNNGRNIFKVLLIKFCFISILKKYLRAYSRFHQFFSSYGLFCLYYKFLSCSLVEHGFGWYLWISYNGVYPSWFG